MHCPLTWPMSFFPNKCPKCFSAQRHISKEHMPVPIGPIPLGLIPVLSGLFLLGLFLLGIFLLGLFLSGLFPSGLFLLGLFLLGLFLLGVFLLGLFLLGLFLLGQAHTNANLTIDGKLSVAKILTHHPLLFDTFDQGLDWTIWKASAEMSYPKLPDILQTGLNAKYSIQSGVDQFQVFCKASGLWASQVAAGSSDPSTSIVKEILRGNPKCSADDIRYLVEISRKFGGSNEDMAGPLRTYFASNKLPGRVIPTSSLKALADLKMSPDQLCPIIVMSILMVLASSHTAGVITSADIKSLASPSKIEHVSQTESISKTMLAHAEQLNLPLTLTINILAEFRTTVVLKLFGKAKKVEKTSLEVLASSTFDELLELSSSPVANPWKAKKGKGKGKGKSQNVLAPSATADESQEGQNTAPVGPGAIMYEGGKAGGLHLQIVQTKGFHEDCFIKLKGTGVIHRPGPPLQKNDDRRRPCGVVDGIAMSDVAAFLAADATDVLVADTADVLNAAKAADDGCCPA